MCVCGGGGKEGKKCMLCICMKGGMSEGER